VRNRREGENIGRRTPFLAGNALRRTVWPPYGRAHTYTLQRFDDPETAGAGFVGRYKNVTQVEAAVADTCRSRKIDCASKVREKGQGLVEGGGCIVTHRHVERFRRDVFLGAIRNGPFNPCGDWFDDRRMKQARVGRVPKFLG